MTDKKTASDLQALAQETAKSAKFSTSTVEQRNRLLKWLRVKPITTIVARRQLDILAPASRINELRKAGHPIDTIFTVEQTEHGVKHRIALYTLRLSQNEGVA